MARASENELCFRLCLGEHVLDDRADLHALLAVATLGTLTHQVVSVAMPVRRVAGVDGFLTLRGRLPGIGRVRQVVLA
jgi:hypothetical protein